MRRVPRLIIATTLIVILGAGTLSAAADSIRLGIEAVDIDGRFFDLTLEPGQASEHSVRFINHGENPARALIYAADVYSIHGGGMGMRGFRDPHTGATDWLNFTGESVELLPGEPIERTFTVAVPDDAAPGDYIAALVVQNAHATTVGAGDGSGQFSQIIRQSIAVAINVPGPREPQMQLTGAAYSATGERSMILVGIENTGNTHLRPSGEFAFSRPEGDTIASTAVNMDTVYAGTETKFEIVLSDTLPPGEYRATVSLEDEDTGAAVASGDLRFVVEEPEAEPTPVPEPAPIGSISPGSLNDNVPTGTLLWMLAGVAMISAITAVYAVLQARNASRSLGHAHSSGHEDDQPGVAVPPRLLNPSPVMFASPSSELAMRLGSAERPAQTFGRAAPRPIRQLTPARRVPPGW